MSNNNGQKKLAVVMAALCLVTGAVIAVCVKNLTAPDESSSESAAPPAVELASASERADIPAGDSEKDGEDGENGGASQGEDGEDGENGGASQGEGGEAVTTLPEEVSKASPDDEYEPAFIDSAASDSGIVGTWKYQDSYYEFNADLTGGFYFDDYKFLYSYKVEGDKLTIDYERQDVTDAEYTFSLEEAGTLTLIGGKGTDGGTYTLERYK